MAITALQVPLVELPVQNCMDGEPTGSVADKQSGSVGVLLLRA